MNRRWHHLRPVLLVLICVNLSSCSKLMLEDVNKPTPEFDFNAFFEGHTRASGWFAGRGGDPKRHFCGDFKGTVDGETLVLDETLYYSDGLVEGRVWQVSINNKGVFIAESDSLVGQALGQIKGNALQMRYTMNVQVEEDGKAWALDFNDFMLLQPDYSVHNITQVYKWGFRLGTVTTQYARHDGSDTCSSMAQRGLSS